VSAAGDAARRRRGLRLLEALGMAALCERVAAGKPLPAIAAALGVELEALGAFVKRPEHAEAYRAARAERAEALAEQALAIVDAADPDDVRILKLRVDTRKWLAAHLDPARFGESRAAAPLVDVDAAHLDLLRRMTEEEEDA
jgi:hypothetical protein